MFLFIYFFVSLFFGGFSSHSRIFTHVETSPLPVKATNLDLYSALLAIEQ